MRKNQKSKKPELLAPAGSYEIFQAVLRAGADAVYLGGNRFGARAYAHNFSDQELLSAIDEAHIHGRKLYLTVNTLLKEQELFGELYDYLLPLYEHGLDAVIVQDLGAAAFIRREFPELHLHGSTQMTVTGRYGAAFLKEIGATRVVTARELSLAEICAIKEHVDIEIESFVHGALCYCYSGQCLLSSMLGGRSGNRGRCAQPCRLPYEVYDASMRKIKTPGNFILSPKDLCTLHALPELLESGIDSFKIEGRMKQISYASTVVSVYRDYIDRFSDEKSPYAVSDADMKKIFDAGNRSGFTDGYYKKKNGSDMITFTHPSHTAGETALSSELPDLKEKIKGIVTLKSDFPATMSVAYGETSVTVSGDTVMPAKKQPLSEEKIRSSIHKTGNTPFSFASLEVVTEGEVFLPMQSLNGLRREALEQLETALLASYRRAHRERTSPVVIEKTSANGNDPSMEHLSVSVERRDQIDAVLSFSSVSDVYLDSLCYADEGDLSGLKKDVETIHAHGKKAYYIFPTIVREREGMSCDRLLAQMIGGGIDGAVARTLDAASLLNGRIPMILDHSIYTWNREAKELARKMDVLRDTAPLELREAELAMRDNTDSEIVLYGYLPLMTSAQCVHANSGMCDHTSCVVYLKDRYGTYFPVKNQCNACYNTIYNSVPLMLFGSLSKLRSMHFYGARLSFTMEEPGRIREIITLYEALCRHADADVSAIFPNGSYTKGHLKRGVE